MALYTAGTAPSAFDFNSTEGYVEKSTDESVTSSTALQDDNHLFFTIAVTGTYIIDGWLYALSAANAAGDIAVGFSFPTGTLHFSSAGPDVTLATGGTSTGQWVTRLSATSGSTSSSYGCSTTTNAIHVHARFVATATGTLRLMWAQDSSNANATTVKAGSHMRVQQVA